jgi:hypothetical protein
MFARLHDRGRPDNFRSRNPGRKISVQSNRCESGVALRSPPAGTRTARRNLLLLFTGAVLTVFATGLVMADPVKKRAAPASGNANRAGHAVLFNEGPPNSQGRQYPGSVTWRADRVEAAGQPPEIVVHADVEIPDLKMKMRMDFKQNNDKSLPASHTVALAFAMPQDVAGGGVIAVPGLLLKFSERGRGVPLAGLAVKVTDGTFLVGLSNVAADREHNLQLLRERQWIDVPMVYANQHRGILAIEKGYHGEDVFRDAMEAWERPR